MKEAQVFAAQKRQRLVAISPCWARSRDYNTGPFSPLTLAACPYQENGTGNGNERRLPPQVADQEVYAFKWLAGFDGHAKHTNSLLMRKIRCLFLILSLPFPNKY